MELDREVAHDLVVPVVLLPHSAVLEHFKAVLEVHELEAEEVLEVHDLRNSEKVEGGLVERSLSNSALLLHLVEFLDLCREAAAQEVLSA